MNQELLSPDLQQFAADNSIDLTSLPQFLSKILTINVASFISTRPFDDGEINTYLRTNQETTQALIGTQLYLLRLWQEGKVDPDYARTVLPQQALPISNLVELFATQEPVLAPLSINEALSQFPSEKNPDGSQSFPLGQTASLELANLQFLWINPWQNPGPTLVIGSENQQKQFFTIMEQAAQKTNRAKVKIWRGRSTTDFLSLYRDWPRITQLMGVHKYNFAVVPLEKIQPNDLTNPSPFFHFWLTVPTADAVPSNYHRFLQNIIKFPENNSGRQFYCGQTAAYWLLRPAKQK